MKSLQIRQQQALVEAYRPEHLLRALTPLYLGRTAAFIVHVRTMSLSRIPDAFEAIDRAFEDEREHLVARWR